MQRKRKIILHIGHGKTGSSALQAALARNHEVLKAAGILYPENADSDRARRGQITSGNLMLEDWFEGHVIPIARGAQAWDRVLFSNENIFHRFDTFLENHQKYADEFDFEVILVVREPFEKLNSAYQQAVKRRGFTGSMAEFADHESDALYAADIIRGLNAQGVAFRLFNYSTLRRGLIRAFFQHLGVWDRIQEGGNADIGTVNRSLTSAELNFLRYVNQVFGVEFGMPIADALVERLPDLPAGAVPIDPKTRTRFYDRLLPAVQAVNAFLPESDQLTLGPGSDGVTNANVETYVPLSEAQIAVIRSVFPTALTYKDGVVLRDIAAKYESGESLTREDAIALMQFAQKARPHGRIIARRLKALRGA